MNIMKSYALGMRAAFGRPRLVLLLWLFNVIFAASAAFVFAGALVPFFDGRLALDGLTKGVDMDVLLEFLALNGESLGGVIRFVLLAVVLYVLASAFATGGILNVLLRGRGERTAGAFFGGGGLTFWRFVRIWIFSIPLWIGAGIVFMGLAQLVRILTRNPLSEMRNLILYLVLAGAALVLFHIVRMILDYARIRMAVEGAKSAAGSLLAALRFVARKPGGTVGLYALFVLTGILFFGLFLRGRSAVPVDVSGASMLVLILTQVHILARSGLRAAFQGGQLEFFRAAAGSSAEPAKGPGGKGDDRPEEIQAGVDGQADQAEGEKQEPDDGKQNEGQEGQGPA